MTQTILDASYLSSVSLPFLFSNLMTSQTSFVTFTVAPRTQGLSFLAPGFVQHTYKSWLKLTAPFYLHHLNS